MNKLKYTIYILVFVLIQFSCSDNYLDENPPHLTTADKLYTSLNGYQAGLNGLYSEVRLERAGLGYTANFGTIDLRSALFMFGTDNVATGSNTGTLHKMLNSWGVANGPSYKEFNTYFLWFYETINSANTIINRAEKSEIDWSDVNGINQQKRIIAEACVFRAWGYRHLTYLWGDVPLRTHESTGSNISTDLVREPVANIRRQMITDLLYAAENLPWTPYNSGSMTKGVALTYLAETYLAINKPDSAYYWANKCITEGPYDLLRTKTGQGKTAFISLFQPANINTSNPEILWCLQWAKAVVGGGENIMRHETCLRYETPSWGGGVKLKSIDERGGRGWSRATILKNALLFYYASSKDTDLSKKQIDERGNEFAIGQYFIVTSSDQIVNDKGEPITNSAFKRPWQVGDTVWIATSKVGDAADKTKSGGYNYNLIPSNRGSNNFPYTLKYAFCDPGYPTNTESHQPQIYMRLAETYLLRAEAYIRMGNIPGAVSDINELRNRANAKTVTDSDLGTSLQDQLDYILDERSRELILEEHRRYTLLRMGGENFMYRRIKEHNTIDGGNFTLRDTIFPIPQNVIDANRTLKMSQNPGYPGS